ncbi:MAG: purine-nucleoside phosphorylase [Candidatus Eremiobacteraeota bacterium]|nr:purine-nucleoside phosphorylase [Candidatus Eremiobacteraeota bacterium]
MKHAARLRTVAGGSLDVAVVLGTGLSEALDAHARFSRTPFTAFGGMPVAALAGHAAQVLIGTWHDRRIVVFAGRVHLYQGFSAQDVTYNVRLAHAAGARTLVLTNAAGALSAKLSAGDLMLISDQLNLTGSNPLAGTGEFAPFVDMTDAYSARLRQLAKAAAPRKRGLRRGIYAGVSGPSYETPAEAAMLRSLGADAVGMSTVLETIQARALGMEVLGLSVITNVVGAPASHQRVTEVAAQAAPRVAEFLDGLLAALQ